MEIASLDSPLAYPATRIVVEDVHQCYWYTFNQHEQEIPDKKLSIGPFHTSYINYVVHGSQAIGQGKHDEDLSQLAEFFHQKFIFTIVFFKRTIQGVSDSKKNQTQ